MITENAQTPKLQTHEFGITQMDVEYVHSGVACLYLIRQEDRVSIIETGTTHSVSKVLALLQQWGLTAEAVDFIIPTHVHLDHAGGASALMNACPNARLVIHPKGARHMIDPSKLIAGTIAVYGESSFKALYGEIQPIAADKVIEAEDNFTLDFNGRTLRFIDTPGHARHHFAVYDELSRGIFTGDTFGLCYPDLETETGPFIIATTTPVQFEPDAMLNSIDKILALQPETIYLTHFGPIKPGQNVVNDLKNCVTEYVAIAEAEKNPEQDRAKRIADKMLAYLIHRLKKDGLRQSEAYCRNKLSMDVKLNSDGLDIWLKRQQAK